MPVGGGKKRGSTSSRRVCQVVAGVAAAEVAWLPVGVAVALAVDEHACEFDTSGSTRSRRTLAVELAVAVRVTVSV